MSGPFEVFHMPILNKQGITGTDQSVNPAFGLIPGPNVTWNISTHTWNRLYMGFDKHQWPVETVDYMSPSCSVMPSRIL